MERFNYFGRIKKYLIIIIGITFLVIFIHSLYKNIYYLKYYKETHGTVEGCDFDPVNFYMTKLYVKFKTLKNEQIDTWSYRMTIYLFFNVCGLNIGDQIKILYDPMDPERAVIKDFNLWFGSLSSLIATMGFMYFGFSGKTLMRRGLFTYRNDKKK